MIEALELAQSLDYKMYLSGILGLPGTKLSQLKKEVENWLSIAEAYAGSITTGGPTIRGHAPPGSGR